MVLMKPYLAMPTLAPCVAGGKPYFGFAISIKNRRLACVYALPCKNLGQFGSNSGKCFPPDEIYSPEIADELALLQDQVEPFDGKLAREQIEQAFGGKLEIWFDDFDETALASASIAQVHTARFNATQPLAGKKWC